MKKFDEDYRGQPDVKRYGPTVLRLRRWTAIPANVGTFTCYWNQGLVFRDARLVFRPVPIGRGHRWFGKLVGRRKRTEPLCNVYKLAFYICGNSVAESVLAAGNKRECNNNPYRALNLGQRPGTYVEAEVLCHCRSPMTHYISRAEPGQSHADIGMPRYERLNEHSILPETCGYRILRPI